MSTSDPRSEVVRYWLGRAEEALISAELEYNAGHHEFAVNRAYYAAFYALSALLLSEGKRFAKHSGVRAALHAELVKTARLSRRWGTAYDRLFEGRHRADYEDLVRFDAQTANRLLVDAQGFVETIKALLKKAEIDTDGTQ